MPVARQPAGSPEGGRFAPSSSPESDVALTDGTGPGPSWRPAQASDLREGDHFSLDGESHRVVSTDGDHKSISIENGDGEVFSVPNDRAVLKYDPVSGSTGGQEDGLRSRIEQALAADDPDPANWPTGDQVDAIVDAVREHDRARADAALEDLYAVRDRKGDYLASLDAAIDTLES